MFVTFLPANLTEQQLCCSRRLFQAMDSLCLLLQSLVNPSFDMQQLTETMTCQDTFDIASCCHLLMSDPASSNVPYHTECIAYHSVCVCRILNHVTAPTDERPHELAIPSEQLAS